MILNLNKSELVVLRDVFGARVRKYGLTSRSLLTKKELTELRNAISSACNSEYVIGDEIVVLDDVYHKIMEILSSKKTA
jgi:predicted amidophosphoribosyltransferase